MTVAHVHKDAHPMRRFAGRRGLWVLNHGDWDRPLHVWLYRGAYRVICRVCLTSIQSGDRLYDGGWPDRSSAMDAAAAHCRDCPKGANP